MLDRRRRKAAKEQGLKFICATTYAQIEVSTLQHVIIRSSHTYHKAQKDNTKWIFATCTPLVRYKTPY